MYNVHAYLIPVIERYYRQYETRDQETWARGKLERELRIFEVG